MSRHCSCKCYNNGHAEVGTIPSNVKLCHDSDKENGKKKLEKKINTCSTYPTYFAIYAINSAVKCC